MDDVVPNLSGLLVNGFSACRRGKLCWTGKLDIGGVGGVNVTGSGNDEL